MWKRFNQPCFDSACDLGLLAGDGISRKIFVFDPTSFQVVERQQELTFISMDFYGFVGLDIHNGVHRCHWSDAISFEKRCRVN